MILPRELAAALGQLPFAGFGRRHSSLSHALGEIQRLTAPSRLGTLSAIGAQVEQLGPSAPREARASAALQQRAPQLVPIEVPVFEKGPLRICRIIGWTV